MKELSFERMEEVEGGSCAGAIGVAAFSAVAMGAATYFAPWMWTSPKTWYAASTLIAGNAAFLYAECKN